MTTARYYYVGQVFREPAHLRQGRLLGDAVRITTLRYAPVPAGAEAVLNAIGYRRDLMPHRVYFRAPEQFESLIRGWDKPSPLEMPQ